MRNISIVAWREFAENAKTKGFWIGLFMFPLILMLTIQVPIWLGKKAAPTRHFFVVDYSGEYLPAISNAVVRAQVTRSVEALREYVTENLVPAGEAAQPKFDWPARDGEQVQRFMAEGGAQGWLRRTQPRLRAGAPAFEEPAPQLVLLPDTLLNQRADASAVLDELRPYLREEKRLSYSGKEVRVDAAVIVPRDASSFIRRAGSAAPEGGLQYWAANLSDKTVSSLVENAINQLVREKESRARGLDLSLLREIDATRLPLVSLNPKKAAGQEKVSKAEQIGQYAPVVFVYLLWVAIFSVCQMLLNNTIEEKSNRLIEVLLSSVSAGEFMIGKLLGIAAVGLTMVLAWTLALFGVGWWQSGGNPMAQEVLANLRNSALLPAFVVYFCLGYLLYATLILAIGSVCNTLKEAQNYMAAITMVMVVPLLTMMFIPRDPNGTLATVLSWIPLYTPFVMMNRAAADPPLRDLIGTAVLLLVSNAVALWMAIKIFRMAILRTGQPPRLIELVRWLRDSRG